MSLAPPEARSSWHPTRDVFFSRDKKEASGVLLLTASPREGMPASAPLPLGDASTAAAGIGSAAGSAACPALASRRGRRSLMMFCAAGTCWGCVWVGVCVPHLGARSGLAAPQQPVRNLRLRSQTELLSEDQLDFPERKMARQQP